MPRIQRCKALYPGKSKKTCCDAKRPRPVRTVKWWRDISFERHTEGCRISRLFAGGPKPCPVEDGSVFRLDAVFFVTEDDRGRSPVYRDDPDRMRGAQQILILRKFSDGKKGFAKIAEPDVVAAALKVHDWEIIRPCRAAVLCILEKT